MRVRRSSGGKEPNRKIGCTAVVGGASLIDGGRVRSSRHNLRARRPAQGEETGLAVMACLYEIALSTSQSHQDLLSRR